MINLVRLTEQFKIVGVARFPGYATPANYTLINKRGTQYPQLNHWWCAICGRQKLKTTSRDVDHIFNLIYNTFFGIQFFTKGIFKYLWSL